MLQDQNGHVHDKWVVTPRDEEQIILQQFLRFGETKAIAHDIILQDARDAREKTPIALTTPPPPKTESEIRRFLERSQPVAPSAAAAITRSLAFETRHFLRPMPYLHTGGAVAGRLLSPSSLSGFAASPAALLGSPLSRMQTMQPFDYRRERLSPALSTASDKSLPPHISPQNLSVSAVTVTPALTPLPRSPSPKPLAADVTAAVKVERIPLVTPFVKEEPNDCVLNFSIKDNPVLSAAVSAASAAASAAASPALSPHEDSRDGRMDMATAPLPVPTMSSIYADLKVKHLRKSANPMKRHWQPSPGFGSTLVSASGKKRVLCSACNKSFCDKGALKIHYSAVHLKEMHKCTVDSCNMMFSSRRSRNRHSANPNPKLHMMQSRRRLPEGATVIDDGAIAPPDSLSEPLNMVLPSSIPFCAPDTKPTDALLQRSLPTLDMSHVKLPPAANDVPAMIMSVIGSMPVPPVMPTHESLVASAAAHLQHRLPMYIDPLGGMPLGGMPLASLLMAPALLPPPLLATRDLRAVAQFHRDFTDERDDGDDEAAGGGRPAGDMHRNSRKRKSLMPTRCAQTEDMFVMSDDNSNDGQDNGQADRPPSGKRLTIDIAPQPEDLTTPGKREERETGKEQAADEDGGKGSESEESGAEFSLKQVDGLPAQPQDSESDGSHTPHYTPECNHILTNGNGLRNGSGAASGDSELSDEDEEGLGMNGVDMGSAAGSESDGSGDNPRRCPQCGKTFQNHFGVKTHFQNVHLKLMHTCVVSGCNAAFPSKRSRDRHSSNLNLHRKLLSTSSPAALDISSPGGDDSSGGGGGGEALGGQSLREEFLPCIYDGQHLQQGKADIEDDSGDSRTAASPTGNDSPKDPSSRHSVHAADHSPTDYSSGALAADTPVDSADETGSATTDVVRCHLCELMFRDNLALKEHCEKAHPRDTYRCNIRGCEKIFSTRKSRNRHSQNDNLHRHLIGMSAASPPTQSPDRLQANALVTA